MAQLVLFMALPLFMSFSFWRIEFPDGWPSRSRDRQGWRRLKNIYFKSYISKILPCCVVSQIQKLSINQGSLQLHLCAVIFSQSLVDLITTFILLKPFLVHFWLQTNSLCANYHGYSIGSQARTVYLLVCIWALPLDFPTNLMTAHECYMVNYPLSSYNPQDICIYILKQIRKIYIHIFRQNWF